MVSYSLRSPQILYSHQCPLVYLEQPLNLAGMATAESACKEGFELSRPLFNLDIQSRKTKSISSDQCSNNVNNTTLLLNLQLKFIAKKVLELCSVLVNGKSSKPDFKGKSHLLTIALLHDTSVQHNIVFVYLGCDSSFHL